MLPKQGLQTSFYEWPNISSFQRERLQRKIVQNII
jgi:hypothetical protein